MTNIVFKNISNRDSGDRFIPNRSNANLEMAHFKLISNENNSTIKDIFSLNPRLKPIHLNKYQDLLQSTINYHDSSIYSFKNKPNIQKKKQSSNKVSTWPCVPRKYPILSKPDVVLDWPISNVEIIWNIVDWGSNGFMATIWCGEVYLWRSNANRKEEITETQIKAHGALRWNNKGTLLAVAGCAGNLSIWALPEKKLQYTCKCFSRDLEVCNISCLAWDFTDTFLVSGCSSGILAVWRPDGKVRHCMLAHWSGVITLAFDSSNKYLCSSGSDGMVRIWLWPKIEPHVEINYCSPIRAIAFHPWRPSLLAVGGGLNDGSLSIWNVSTCRKIAYYRPDCDSLVDCLTWNPVTGELVSSHQLLGWNRSHDALEGAETKVLVLAGLDNVVDCLDVEEHGGRVLYLMWDKTGTKLGTACTDESLCIWNFLGDRKNGETTKNKILGPTRKSVLSNFEKCIR